MTTRVHNLTYLQSMMGDPVTEQEATTARDRLIAVGMLTWTSDNDGGWLQDITDNDFYSITLADHQDSK